MTYMAYLFMGINLILSASHLWNRQYAWAAFTASGFFASLLAVIL